MNPQHRINRLRNRLHRILRELSRRKHVANESKDESVALRTTLLSSRADEILALHCSYTIPTRADVSTMETTSGKSLITA